MLKNRYGRLGFESGRILFAKRLKRVYKIITRRPLGQSPHLGNSALSECRLVLQKFQIGPTAPIALSCLGAVWTPLLGFFGRPLYLDTFSSSVYDFFFFLISFLDNSGFLRAIILNNYLEKLSCR